MKPYIYDLTVVRGAAFHQRLDLANVDMTGVTAKAQIRPEKGSETLTAEITCTVDADAKTVTLSLADSVTAGIDAGDYWYDVFLALGTGRECVLAGKFTVLERVTVYE